MLDQGKRLPPLEKYRQQKLESLKYEFCLDGKMSPKQIDSVINASTYYACDCAARQIFEELL